MDLSLQALVERTDTFLSLREAQRGSLERTAGERTALLERFPELASQEIFALASGESGARPLVQFLGRFAEEWDARQLTARIASHLQEARIPVATHTFAYAEAKGRVQWEAERLLREGLEQGLDRLYWELRDLYTERCQKAVETSQRLGFGSYAEFQAHCGLRPATSDPKPPSEATQTAEVEQFLKQTADSFRDLLNYALKKIGVERSTARYHDAIAAVAAPWLNSQLRREEALPGWSSWLDSSGLGFRAEGRIAPELDLEQMEGRSPRAVALSVPDKIQLLAPPVAGLAGYAALLDATGRAQHWAHLNPKWPLLERRLLAPTALETSAQLFGALLTDSRWLRRTLGLAPHVANDVAKLAVLHALWKARRDCALWGYQPSVFSEGPAAARAERYVEAMREALGVEIPQGCFLRDAEERHETPARLSGAAAAASLRRTLQTRFDEDYWRNPAAGEWLRDHWSQSSPRDGEPPSLTEAGAAWVKILNA